MRAQSHLRESKSISSKSRGQRIDFYLAESFPKDRSGAWTAVPRRGGAAPKLLLKSRKNKYLIVCMLLELELSIYLSC